MYTNKHFFSFVIRKSFLFSLSSAEDLQMWNFSWSLQEIFIENYENTPENIHSHPHRTRFDSQSLAARPALLTFHLFYLLSQKVSFPVNDNQKCQPWRWRQVGKLISFPLSCFLVLLHLLPLKLLCQIWWYLFLSRFDSFCCQAEFGSQNDFQLTIWSGLAVCLYAWRYLDNVCCVNITIINRKWKQTIKNHLRWILVNSNIYLFIFLFACLLVKYHWKKSWKYNDTVIALFSRSLFLSYFRIFSVVYGVDVT